MQKPYIPPAWNYNPSTWGQRLPLVIVAFIGMLIALYMGAYQLKIIDDVWDPLFADATNRILHSYISKILPVPDAILGAFRYFADVATGVIGRPSRWHTLPWMVIVFGIALGPLGLVSILLVISPRVFVNA